jgi:hypothetical protein
MITLRSMMDLSNILEALLEVVPHVKDWWDTYCEQRVVEESAMIMVPPTWDSYWDSIEEQ